MSTTKAIRDLLLADEELTSYLAEYEGEPAIFSADFLPPEADHPYIMMEAEVTAGRERLLDGSVQSIDIDRDIKLFTDATGSTIEVEAAANRIADVLEGARPSVDGWRRAKIEVVNGPVGLSADTDSYGRLVSVRVHLTH